MADEQETNILTKVCEKVEECFLKADAFYGDKIPRCSIKFNLTGTRAGTANYGKRALRFNRKLLVDNPEHFLNETCPHEVAHIVQFWKYWGKVNDLQPHGREWRKIMVEIFRIPPKRCHKLDVSKVKRKTQEFRYTCNCVGRQHMFGLIHHKRAIKGTSYHCKKCSGKLQFEGKGKVERKGLQETELD